VVAVTTPRADLSSTANPRVKAALRLRDRRERDRTGLTLVDGAREARRAIEAGVAIVEAFVCEPQADSDDARSVLKMLARGRGWTAVSQMVSERLAFGDRADGIVVVIRSPVRSLESLDLPPDPLLVVVEGVEKPGNLGAILRSADGAGASAVIAADPRTDLFNPNVIRASLGTIFVRPVVRATSDETIAWLRDRAIRIVAARVDGPILYTEADLAGAVAIVLGSEAAGLTDAWSSAREIEVSLPMLGMADSLNVSAAAAVLLYEALRQRRVAGPP
jgi:TrmH family RNA methyltransferase